MNCFTINSIVKILVDSDKIRGVAQSGRVLALGARCRRFESFRPDQKIQPVAFAAGFVFCLERADLNDKRSFVMVRIFHSIYRQMTINLRVSSVVIRTALTPVLIYSDSPRPEN